MKGFIAIEFLRGKTPIKAVVSVSSINFVEETSEGKAQICFEGVEEKKKRSYSWHALCIETVETYSEVLAKIDAAVLE